MEELWENYVNARENNLPTTFNLLVFFNFGILKDGFTDPSSLARRDLFQLVRLRPSRIIVFSSSSSASDRTS